jgi:hypothetical protein
MLSKTKKSTKNDASLVTDKTAGMKKSKKNKLNKSPVTEDLVSSPPKNGVAGKKKRKMEVNTPASPKKSGGKNKKSKSVPQQPEEDDSSDISISDDSNEEFPINDSNNEASDSEEEQEAPVSKKAKKEKAPKKVEATTSQDPLDSAEAQHTVITDEETKAETQDRIRKRDLRTLFLKGNIASMTHKEILELAPGCCDARTKKSGIAYMEFKSEKKAEKAFAHLKTLEVVGDKPLQVDFLGEKSQKKTPVKENRSVGEMKIRTHVLYVGGLPSTVTESDLMQVFQGAEQVRLPKKRTAEISCYAYIIFKTAEGAMKAFKEAKDLVVKKKPVIVLFAKGLMKKQKKEAQQQQRKEGDEQKTSKKHKARKHNKKNKNAKKEVSE